MGKYVDKTVLLTLSLSIEGAGENREGDSLAVESQDDIGTVAGRFLFNLKQIDHQHDKLKTY